MKFENVMKRVYDPERLKQAWEQVRRNAGKAGIDKMTVEQFESDKELLLKAIQEKLMTGTYRFKPARRVLIPKPGSKKRRKLGIPVVMDRIVAQSMNLALDEIFDPGFSDSNFGFRRGKSQHSAIRHVREAIQEGHEWCVSIDLESFFDEIPHGLILKLVRRKIYDERLVTLIARALKAGVVVDGQFEKTEKGSPQGSPVSPMLSNIVLNELDQELERRGLRFCRWADDFIILTKSERAANRVMESATKFLENGLGLKVNRGKSEVTHSHKVSFLGFKIQNGKIGISKAAKAKFKKRVKELTKRNNPLSMKQIIKELNEYLTGWVGYFRIQEYKTVLERLDTWIRTRLRSMQLKKWKKPKRFQKMMILAGYPVDRARRTWVKMNRWSSAWRKEVRRTMHLRWFRRKKLVFLDDFTLREPEVSLSR